MCSGTWKSNASPARHKRLTRPLTSRVPNIAAKTDCGPCVTYVGPDGAGHFVKMVHNGIEYGDMQLIAEAYAILNRALGLDAQELSDIRSEERRVGKERRSRWSAY